MAEVFANPLVDLAEYTDMKQDMDKGKGPVQVSGVTDSQKVHVMHELSKDNPWRLVVTYDDTRAKEIFDDFSYFEPNTWLYPARDLLFYSSDIHGNLLTRQRMQVFKHLLEDEGGVVVTTVDGLMDHLLPLSMIKESCLNIMVGQTLDMEEIKHLLTGMGYERMGQVDGMGQFSVRGGILDVFPLTEEVPVRIELWGDEVDLHPLLRCREPAVDPADGRGYDLPGGGADPHEGTYRRGNFASGSRREKAGKSVPGPEKAGGGTADPAGCRGACRILKRGL